MRGMGKRGPLIASDRSRAAGESALGTLLMLALLAIVAFAATYSVMSALHGSALPGGGRDEFPSGEGMADIDDGEKLAETDSVAEVGKPKADSTCRGIEHFELWGEVDKWGSSNLVDTAEDCCRQCSQRCQSADACSCNTWVFCGNKEACGENFKQCWLKRQEDVLKPDVHGLSPEIPWTSGLIHAPGKGIIALATDHGNIRIKLESTWAPITVNYIRDLLQMKYCTGCQFYRAEGLGEGWNSDGSRTSKPPGPPYALVQGTLQTDGLPYKPIPREAAPVVKRGYVCLVGEGPDFFISLADHTEWGNAHTVFGRVPEEDLNGVLKKILALENKQETWGETKVLALASPVNFKLERDTTGIVL